MLRTLRKAAAEVIWLASDVFDTLACWVLPPHSPVSDIEQVMYGTENGSETYGGLKDPEGAQSGRGS